MLSGMVNPNVRAGRCTYWTGHLLLLVPALCAIALMDAAPVASIIILVPTAYASVCLSVNRLHDSGNSGGWLLITLVPYLGGVAAVVIGLLSPEKRGNAWGAPRHQQSSGPAVVA